MVHLGCCEGNGCAAVKAATVLACNCLIAPQIRGANHAADLFFLSEFFHVLHVLFVAFAHLVFEFAGLFLTGERRTDMLDHDLVWCAPIFVTRSTAGLPTGAPIGSAGGAQSGATLNSAMRAP